MSGGDTYVIKSCLSGRWRNCPLTMFSGVHSAAKMPMALHYVGPWFLDECLELQMLSDVVNEWRFRWQFELRIFLPLERRMGWHVRVCLRQWELWDPPPPKPTKSAPVKQSP